VAGTFGVVTTFFGTWGEGRVTTVTVLTEIINFRKSTVICLILFHLNNFKSFECKKIIFLFKIFILLLGMATPLPPAIRDAAGHIQGFMSVGSIL
jgi:hypothetical protein